MTPTRTRVKMCGLTRPDDVAAAVSAGVDALGFVFYPPSARAVSTDQAARLMRAVPPFVSKVALFVNASETVVNDHLATLPIDLLQFHGDESPAYCAQFKRPWVKVARMGVGLDLLEFATRYAGQPGCVGLLADTLVDGFGGAGKRFDWALIPAQLPLPLVLSGGLHPDNVGAAIRAVRPWAVDVSSGIEPAGGPKGVKSADEIQRFMAGVNHADAAQ
jgi:phosphoribosylanthranilate isomerase